MRGNPRAEAGCTCHETAWGMGMDHKCKTLLVRGADDGIDCIIDSMIACMVYEERQQRKMREKCVHQSLRGQPLPYYHKQGDGNTRHSDDENI